MIWNRLKRILFHLFSVLQLGDLSYLLNAIPSHHHLRKPLSPTPFSPVGRKRMILKKSRLGFANAFHLHVNSLDQNKTTQINEVSNWKSIVYESIKPLSQKVSTDIGYWASKGKPFQLQGQNLSETDKLHYTTQFRRGSRSSKNNLVSCNTLMFKTPWFCRPKKNVLLIVQTSC